MVPDPIPLAADPCCNQRGGVVLSLGRPMRRREFISLIGGAVAWPLAAARAQRSDGIRRVGVLMIPDKSDPSGQALASAFQGRLSELGWNEGRNIKIDYQWGAGNPEVVQRYVADMVATSPDVILANGTPAVSALHHAFGVGFRADSPFEADSAGGTDDFEGDAEVPVIVGDVAFTEGAMRLADGEIFWRWEPAEAASRLSHIASACLNIASTHRPTWGTHRGPQFGISLSHPVPLPVVL